MNIPDRDFFLRHTEEVARDLIGRQLYRAVNGKIFRGIINETEAYHGTEDKACHCSKGRTPRTDIMFREGGNIYVYLIYGMYHMLNFTTGPQDLPGAVLIRSIAFPEFSLDGENFYPLEAKTDGPGKLTRSLQIDKSLNTLPVSPQSGLWIAGEKKAVSGIQITKRIGIDYADEWKDVPWRFYVPPEKL